MACTCGGGPACHPGKHPIFVSWRQRATADEETIREWLVERYPGANYGIPTGSNPILDRTLMVIDADLKDGINGIASLEQESFDTGTPLPITVMVETGSRGRHWYYSAPAGVWVPNRAGFLPGVDLRGEGGYVLGAGSAHVSGREYAFVEEQGPDEQIIVECPGFLLDIPEVDAPTTCQDADPKSAQVNIGAEMAVHSKTPRLCDHTPCQSAQE